MDRRNPNNIVVANIAAASSAAGVQVASLISDSRKELTYGDLLDIGGALRVSPASFLEGVRSA